MLGWENGRLRETRVRRIAEAGTVWMTETALTEWAENVAKTAMRELQWQLQAHREECDEE